MKAAAGEQNTIIPQSQGHSEDGLGEGFVKGGREVGDAVMGSRDKRGEGRAPVDDQAVLVVDEFGSGQRDRNAGLQGREFQRHGGFTFETAALAQAEQRGGGIEQAAGRGGERGLQAGGEHGGEDCVLGAGEMGGMGRVAVNCVKHAKRGAAGLANGRLGTGKTEGEEMGGAVVGWPVEGEELTAPDGAIRAEAGTIPDDPEERG